MTMKQKHEQDAKMETPASTSGRTIKREIFSARDDALSTLAAAFPEAVKDGEVDWDALKAIFKDAPAAGPEKYELTWAGKAEAKREAGRDVVGRTLRFCPEESKDAETTQNLYIEGDNLEVLKLLRENYYGAVKMIYIDPPYNTGNDFVYRDNFTQSEMESELAEGNIDAEGQRLVKNPKSSNRYHANWLSMIHPRLRIAHDILSQEGAILVSIDDNEIHNLMELCDEIFGRDNHVATIIWQKVFSPKNSAKHFSEDHEYILVYSRNSEIWRPKLLPRTEEMNARYGNPDNDPRGVWSSSDLCARNYYSEGEYSVTCPSGRIINGPPTGSYWRVSKKTFLEMEKENRIWWGADGNNMPRQKRFLSEVQNGVVPQTLWTYESVGHTQEAKRDLTSLITFDSSKEVFDTPKPVRLIKQMLKIGTASTDNDIVIDFFAGSGTTAHAIMDINAEDGGNRRFILVQLPEQIDSNSFPTIGHIARERIRRAGEKIKTDLMAKIAKDEGLFKSGDAVAPKSHDVGFKVFKTADTVIRWTHDALHSDMQKTLEEGAMSDKDKLDFMPGFSDIDVVYEIALRQNGIPLSAPIRPQPAVGKRTYLFADSILVCLAEKITPELVEALSKVEPIPAKFVLRDSAFEDDIALKDETLRRLKACIARNTKEAKPAYVVDFI
jgi:adenine-specific DNA-methyltransferase